MAAQPKRYERRTDRKTTPTPSPFGASQLMPSIADIEKYESDKIIRKISNLNIPEEEINRIADEIKSLRPPLPASGITTEDIRKLSAEELTRLYSSGNVTILSKEDIETNPYKIINNEMNKLVNHLKSMSGDDIKTLYEELDIERRTLTTEPHINFTIVSSPLSERLIANVTELRWNGVDLLQGKNIMLYESTGGSRLTGLGGRWLPYTGEKRSRVVAKLEDKYIEAIKQISNNTDINEYYKSLLRTIILNINTHVKYMRFIDKTYLIASFLLLAEKNNYMSNPANQEHISKYIREYNSEEKRNALINVDIILSRLYNDDSYIDYIPMTTELIDELIKSPQKGAGHEYFIKYLKYKTKYLSLKHNNL